MEMIEVIDTAVKVGLGALISGITTYKVTKLNAKTNRENEFSKRKSETILFAIEKIEIYLNSFNNCYSRLTGLLSHGVLPGTLTDTQFKWYKEADKEIVSAWKERDIAVSRLKLIGLNNAAQHIANIGKLEIEFRQMVIFQKKLPSYEELQKISKSLASSRDEIYLLLHKSIEQNS